MIREITVTLAAAVLLACGPVEKIETSYPDGRKKSVSPYLRKAGGILVPHGVHLAWYPDGSRMSMDVFLHGRREGYSLRWHPDGALKAMEHYTEGRLDAEPRKWDESGSLVLSRDRDPAGREARRGWN